MNRTGIDYLNYTWNPTHGCSPISPGCANCWAHAMSKRLAGMGVGGYDKAEPFRVTYHPDRLVEPLKLRKPARIGVSFMGDLFHEYVHDGFIRRVIEITAETAQHQYLILTKRPTRMRKYFHEYGFEGHGENLELGVTVENADCLWRVDELLKIPAAVRFVSLEPLLGPVNIRPLLACARCGISGVDWVIVGCEKGPGRRRCDLDWIRGILYDCRNADVPCFVKQIEVDGRVSSDPNEWPEDLRVREYPKSHGGTENTEE